ncbi:MAG: response regulator [Nitriliruptorales bacterium]
MADASTAPPAEPGRDVAGRTRRILVVDDEPMVREVVTGYLEREGFQVEVAADGRAALEALRRRRPDLVILDLMLPKVGGLDILRGVRQISRLPVIVLTARADEGDRVLGLELGADDYVVKPFSPRELGARVRSVLRRAAPPDPGGRRLEFDGLTIDTASREVVVSGEAVALTALEFELLAFLAATPRTVFSRAELLASVWGSSPAYQDPSTVTVHIRRLRKKIEEDPGDPRWIRTVFGIGYRFDP